MINNEKHELSRIHDDSNSGDFGSFVVKKKNKTKCLKITEN
jgi:hypothetical protein